MKIYLIRHGQTTGDVENRYGGDYDDELTDKGQSQVDELIDKLKDVKFEAIFSSPKTRAKQVAEKMSMALGCEYKILEDLKERNKNGVLTGLTKEDAKKKYPDLVEKVKDYKNQIKGAEAFTDFVKRVNKVWREILRSKYSTIAVVTHGGIIVTIIKDILGFGFAEAGDCGYVILNYDQEKFEIDKMEGIEYKPLN